MELNRRDFLKLSAAQGMLLHSSPTAFGSRATPRTAPKKQGDSPNVLFICIDDMNDWVGCMGGHPDAITPNIDKLAERGVLFTNAHCSSALCGPSRASVMSGLRPSTTGIYDNTQPLRAALPTVRTLPQYFKEYGYNTLGSGKIFHDADPPSWSNYYPALNNPIIWNPNPAGRPLNGIPPYDFIPDKVNFDWGAMDIADDAMGDSQSFLWAEQMLEEEHDAPFFLAVGTLRPHLPWFAPRQYFDLYDEATITLPAIQENDGEDIPQPGKRITNGRVHNTVVDAGQYRKAIVAYLASISYVDAIVGRLIEALDASAYADNTIIIFWSDNGYHLGEKQRWQKWTLWEESTRVPLIMSGPGIEQQDVPCGRTVSLLDLYPTLLDLCGLPPNESVEGDSVRSLLDDPTAEWDRPVVTTALFNWHAVRSETWRYIQYDNGAEELYNHEDDPNEWVNLAGDEQYADIKTKMAGHLPQINAPAAPESFLWYTPLVVNSPNADD